MGGLMPPPPPGAGLMGPPMPPGAAGMMAPPPPPGVMPPRGAAPGMGGGGAQSRIDPSQIPRPGASPGDLVRGRAHVQMHKLTHKVVQACRHAQSWVGCVGVYVGVGMGACASMGACVCVRDFLCVCTQMGV